MFVLMIHQLLLAELQQTANPVAPVLDIDDEKTGYIGQIGERNVLVDLKPHLQIRNIDQINGICSYHVFKPNNEEFPFTIDIKDKMTGEAVIEVLKKDLDSNAAVAAAAAASTASELSDSSLNEKKQKLIFLDCNKRKEFSFLIQAHDCSSPSIPSNKIPVKIEVIDHDDFVLQFENPGSYNKKLATSNMIYDNVMTVKARDNDCTNDGFACSYQLVSDDEMSIILDDKFPFNIDINGVISSTHPLTKVGQFSFKVRAIDCLNKDEYVEVPVHIEVVDSCSPQWADYLNDLTPASESTNLFETMRVASCDQHDQDLLINVDSECKIGKVNANLKFVLDPAISNACNANENCDDDKESITSKVVLFSGKPDTTSSNSDEDADSEDDDEDDDDESGEENKIVKASSSLDNKPLNFRTFSKEIENAQKIDFDGRFTDVFTLSAWLRRPADADKQIKEQVFCGADSHSMNRHHFGLYFYRGNIKFLLRKEATAGAEVEKFYPSLWQWTLSEKLLTDKLWHLYEIKFSYPKAELFIDGGLFVENLTNSDIIDALELKNTNEAEPVSTYIGACYHARTNSLVDHFEGDIGPVRLIKKINMKKPDQSSECKPICDEAIQINMVGNEKFINSIKNSNSNEISIETSNLNDMSQLIAKVIYVNRKISKPKIGSRNLVLNTTIQCSNNGKQINLNSVSVNLNIKYPKREYNIQLKGEDTQIAFKSQLVNGIKPFSKVSIEKIVINQVDGADSRADEQDDSTDLSRCQLHFDKKPNEKLLCDQSMLDEFNLDFKESPDTYTISGLQTGKNYETFIRTLSYQANPANSKIFVISCVRNEPHIETNSITVKLNVTEDQLPNFGGKFVAHKQKSQLVASDDDVIETKDYKKNNQNELSTPLMIALIVMCSCAMGFLLLFGAVRLRSVGYFGGKKKNLINEENPQMEWDDSGLNITENPLDNFDSAKKFAENSESHQPDMDHDEEYSSYEEDGDEDGDEDDENEEYEDEEEQYSSEEEEQEKVVIDRELEWDDTSIEIKDKRLQKNNILSNSKHLGNKSLIGNDFNNFV